MTTTQERGDMDTIITELDVVATAYGDARKLTIRHRDRLIGLVAKAVAEGMSEREVARRAGVDRMTIRKWTGKGRS